MKAGKMDREITINTKSVPGSGPNPKPSTTSQMTVWAEVRPMTGNEKMNANNTTAEWDTKFFVYFDDAVWEAAKPKNQIEHDGTTYDIQSRREIGRRDGIEILARARS